MKYVLLLTLVLAAQLPAAAQGERRAVDRAAATLVAAQHDYPSAAASWSWKASGDHAAPNAAGVVALGLVHVFQRTGDRAALEAARRWGEARLTDLAAWRPLFDPDVSALAALGRVLADTRFERAARVAFDRRWGQATGREALARLKMVRRGQEAFVGFDAALAIRAAEAVGAADFARSLAQAVVNDGRLLPKVGDVRGVGITVRAVLVLAVGSLRDQVLAGPVARWTVEILSAQGADGSWGFHDTQATAYAVAALATVGTSPAAAAAIRGRAWLAKAQRPDGVFPTFDDGLAAPFSGDVVHEVSAEALMALTGPAD